MFTDPREVFRLFMAIPPERIQRDIESSKENQARLYQELESLRSVALDVEASPQDIAEIHHNHLVLARVSQDFWKLTEAQRLFTAAHAAESITQVALEDADNIESLRRIGKQMESIERRAGLEWDESWPVGEGPAEYQELDQEYEAAFEKMRAAIFETMLARYDLKDAADLFSNDRARFEEQREAGRKEVHG